MAWTVYTIEYDFKDRSGNMKHAKEWWVLKSAAIHQLTYCKTHYSNVTFREDTTEDLVDFINKGNYGIKPQGGING